MTFPFQWINFNCICKKNSSETCKYEFIMNRPTYEIQAVIKNNKSIQVIILRKECINYFYIKLLKL